MKPVIVIGAGWAGLSAAAELCRRGMPVRVMEAAGQVGGRARRIESPGRRLDCGQHLFLGAFRATLGLLRTIGVREDEVFERTPLQLCIRAPLRDIRVRLGEHPAPLHLIRGLQSLTGLSLGERLRAVGLGVALARQHAAVAEDVCVAEWLARHHQSPALIEGIWEPLCRATLNTPAREASTAVFLRVLHDAFLRRREDSDLLIPKTDLSTIVPDPAVAFVRAHGGSVELHTRVTGLQIAHGAIASLTTDHGTVPAERVIVAVPYDVSRTLLAPHPGLQAIAGLLSTLIATPICTVYLEFPRPVSLEAPFVGIVNGTPYWLFDRARQGQPATIAVVISGPGPHTGMNDADLSREVGAKLARFYPRWPVPEHGVVVHEPDATFACRTHINTYRPGNATPVKGCWLAGDYTNTGYPATLEGAVMSGVEAARLVMQCQH
jgi:squalene-associated FAD-dependent desaturase